MISLMVGALPLSKPRDLKLLRLLSQLFSGLSGVRLESNSSVSKGGREGVEVRDVVVVLFGCLLPRGLSYMAHRSFALAPTMS